MYFFGISHCFLYHLDDFLSQPALTCSQIGHRDGPGSGIRIRSSQRELEIKAQESCKTKTVQSPGHGTDTDLYLGQA